MTTAPVARDSDTSGDQERTFTRGAQTLGASDPAEGRGDQRFDAAGHAGDVDCCPATDLYRNEPLPVWAEPDHSMEVEPRINLSARGSLIRQPEPFRPIHRMQHREVEAAVADVQI